MSPRVYQLIRDIENNHIVFHKRLKFLTGNTYSAIILTHAIRTWKLMGQSYFQKFKEPCKHRLYSPGTSWCEELGLTRSEFDNGFKKIAHKVRQFSEPIPSDKFIKFYTDSVRVSYFALSEDNLEKALSGVEMKPFSLTDITASVKAEHKEKYLSKNLNVRQAHNYFLLLMQENGYTASNIMTSKEAGLFKGLIKTLQGYGISIQDYLANTISDWNTLRRGLVWEGSNRSRLREKPSIEELSLSREAIITALKEEQSHQETAAKSVTSVHDIPTNHPAYKRLVDLFNSGVPIKISH